MTDVIGVILAGGKSSRLNGVSKPFISIGSETLIDRAIKKARPQVDELILSVNDELFDQLNYGLPRVRDEIFKSVGPLGGIYSSLDWVSREIPYAKNIIFFTVDVPFFPDDMADKLLEKKNEKNENNLFCLSHRGKIQPLFSLWDVSLKDTLLKHLKNKNYKVRSFFNKVSYEVVEIIDSNKLIFFNVNTFSDLEKLKKLL